LEEFIRKTAKSPFNLIVYTYLSAQKFGSILPVACAVGFFLILAAVQRVVMSAMASAINAYQQREGDLRALHMRVRNHAVSIAAWAGAEAEERSISAALARTLDAQTSMAWTFILQKAFATVCGLYCSGLCAGFWLA
jgi:ABC-type uncharacterized transport system fused permease/ATPase subunit